MEGKKTKILLCEDDQNLGMVLKNYLELNDYDVTLESGEAGAWLARVNGEPVAARVIDPRMRRAPRRDSVAASGSRLVTSAMPGRVVKVLVKPGDRVIERQPLVVVEAMKMENELRAPGDALVRDVNVTEGMSIDAGVILVVLE